MVLLAFFNLGAIYASEVDVSTDTFSSINSNVSEISVDSIQSSENSNDLSQINSISNVYSSNEAVYSSNESNASYIMDNTGDFILVANAKNNTVITPNVTNVTAGASENFYVKLVDESTNKGISNEIVTITINGRSYDRITNNEGYANLPINLKAGNYLVSFKFITNDFYNGYEGSTYLKIIQKNTSLTNASNEVIRGNSFYVLLKDGSGKVMANEIVTISVNGRSYNRITNNNGYANLPIMLKSGIYNISYKYTGNITYNGSYGSNNLKVIVYNTILNGSNLVMTYKDGSKVIVQLIDLNTNKGISNEIVTITINGRSYDRITNSTGFADLPIGLMPGKYNVSFNFKGSTYYLSSEALKTVTINKRTTIITSDNFSENYKAGKYFKVTLKDEFNNILASENVIITINGRSYNVTTDSNGVASLLIGLPVGIYGVTYDFMGSKYYNASKGNGVVIVKGTILSSSDLNMGYKDGSAFNVTAKDALSGNFIVNKIITITVNTRSYNVTTNSDGVASLPIGLPVGTYTITYNFAGDSDFAPAYGSKKITISKGSVILTGSNIVINPGDNKSFNVKLTNNNSSPLANQHVIITVNGISYDRITNNLGIASLPINLPVGYYKISYKFAETANYKSGSGLNYILVNGTILTGNNIKIYANSGEQFSVTLKDPKGNVLSGQTVVITINGISYNRITDSNGVASLPINLSVGNYSVTYSFPGTTSYLPSNGANTIYIIQYSSNNNAVWLFSTDMYNIDLNSYLANGISNIFLNYYAFTRYGDNAVSSWIAQANSRGIKVHIWMQAFFDGEWISPLTSSGEINQTYFNEKVAEAKKYASVSGVYGIHLDYLRFPGTAYKYSNGEKAITEFTKQISLAVRSINPNIKLSAALMPETSCAYYYGQNPDNLGKYLDILVPMVYKGNYNQGTAWITSITKWFNSHSANAEVWTGLQAYKSDNDLTKLSATELANDAKAALNGGAVGVVFFRYGYVNLFNLNNLHSGGNSNGTSNSSSSTVSISDISKAASSVKLFYDTNGKLPSEVTINGKMYSMSQFLYLMSTAIYNIKNGITTNIKVIPVNSCSNSNGDMISSNLLLVDYVDLAKRTSAFCVNYGQAPNYGTTPLGKLSCDSMIEAFSRILNYYNTNNQLPTYVALNSSNVAFNTTNISALAKNLTEGLTSDYDKANAIFKWVRDNIVYSFYYDTKYGAQGTLEGGKANCCDMAHLVVALARSAGLTARYEHGYCYFTYSGNWYGHVWAQILVDGKYINADPTSSRNSFGAIKNWDTSTYTHKAYYETLPF